MSNVVFITSALKTNYGIFNITERMEQTLLTIKSVRTYVQDSIIVLIDNSITGISNDTSVLYTEINESVDYYIDNSEDVDIQYFHNNITNYDVGKNAMEVIGFLKALRTIENHEELRNTIMSSTRIFKLSGRYQVSDQFDITQFDNDSTKDKYVFKQKQPAWIDSTVTGVTNLLQTRLWSFTPSLFEQTIALYDSILKNMVLTFNQNKYIDIEHSMVKYIDPTQLIELSTVGVEGQLAPNGNRINE